ncbi:purine-nucleoside phosphorylase [Xanthovirga aplysinae]|uniref:purine-nucleoside phosphorylase n=1 Tax=Xanthovirga aplysinae TaxID=2529853 RepID=UPI0012BD0033|nr:purine-nucleoside phosphorylase [Xanthovirga aplysinae]MTI31840.1 purine-nucleoside phosphorylase [Xanthovirga aplysinae]
MFERIKEATEFIQKRVSQTPDFGIILGTGLGGLVNELEISEEIPYEEIPHFPVSTVISHHGKLIFGKLEGRKVVVMQGRFHYYEGYSMKEVTFPVRVMKLLGIEKLFISNAAGALNPAYQISDLMVINDHINLMPENPLTGQNLDQFGGRFPDMSEPYELGMIEQAMRIGEELNISIHQGVYSAVPGPNLETKAEYRYLRIIGADAVGMSTVPENIVARHMDLPCFAISVITDICSEGNVKKISIDEIFAAINKAEPNLSNIIRKLIKEQK